MRFARTNRNMDGLLDTVIPKIISVKMTPETEKKLAIGAGIYAVVSAVLIAIAINISNPN